MSILDKAKQLTGDAQEAADKFSGADIIANTIIAAGEKMEATNAILKERGARYRVSGISVSMGIPPSASFSVRRTKK